MLQCGEDNAQRQLRILGSKIIQPAELRIRKLLLPVNTVLLIHYLKVVIPDRGQEDRRIE